MATTSKTAAKKTGATGKAGENIWSDEERAVMKQEARERKKSAKLSPEELSAAGEADVLAAIAAMVDEDRTVAARLHELIRAEVPALSPRTFYGMPAYARDGKVVCFFQAKAKFKVRYYTFGFQQDARLDDDDMWPTSYAITKLTKANERRIVELVRKAAR